MITLTVSDSEETFLLVVDQHEDGIGGQIFHLAVNGYRADAFARTQYNPATRYATAGECLLALMRAIFPALGVRA